MPTYVVTSPDGREIELEGDRPPDKATLDRIFAQLPARGVVPTEVEAAESARRESAAAPGTGPTSRLTGVLGAGPGGLVGRAAKGVDEFAFPTGSVFDPVTSLIDMVASPVRTVDTVIQAGQQQMTPALTNLMSGKGGVEDVAKAVAGAVPIAGPLVTQLSEKAGAVAGRGMAGEDVSGDVAELAGNMLGLWAGGKIGNKVVGATTGAVGRGARAAGILPEAAVPGAAPTLSRAEQLKTLLTPGERSGSRARLFVEGVLEGSPFSGDFWRNKRRLQQEGLRSHINQTLQEISPGDNAAAVRAIPDAIERARQGQRAQFDKIYGEIDEAVRGTTERFTETVWEPSQTLLDQQGRPIQVPRQVAKTREVGGVRPETAALKKFAQEELAKLDSPDLLVPPGEIARARSVLQQVVDSADDVTFQGMQQTKSVWSSMTRGADAVSSHTEGLVKKLTTLADNAMEQAAMKSGKPGLLQTVRSANADYKEFVYTFNKSVVSRIVETAVENRRPEAIVGVIMDSTTSPDDLARLQTVLPKNMVQAVKAGAFEEMISRSEIFEKGFPGQTPDLSPTGVRLSGMQIDGPKLAKALNDFAKDKNIRGFVAPSEIRAMVDLAETARKVSPKAHQAMFALLGTGAGIAAASAQGLAKAAGSLAASVGGTRALSWLITTPQGAKAASAFLRAADKAATAGRAVTTPEMQFWARRIQQLQAQQERQAEQFGAQQPQSQPQPSSVGASGSFGTTYGAQ